LGLEHLEKDPKFENAKARTENLDEIMGITKEIFLTKTRDEWWQLFKAVPIPSAPVNDMEDLTKDPQVIANEYITEVEDPTFGKMRVAGIPVKLLKTPGKVKTLAPELGQHTEEVLMEICGYTWDDIGKLRDEGVY
jgi:crotonobetainyl-CoA:carnitine CoA-transferase CaiB-like acyl-CoA transferase